MKGDFYIALARQNTWEYTYSVSGRIGPYVKIARVLDRTGFGTFWKEAGLHTPSF